ncbi:TIGR03086 family metal-binding protein [Kitasatospora sp. RB6PN24]|uniref:TIGR03086 family metal-binding protein n=1 Tax=Kitasatospora humi TaxID=2893891 RepID=UPI001E354BE6|nr:TIGR03086 family metal-binding protein [Kitasatospora humi]MCC9308471.1 TIGR03086 family metal-binding protein [Kitasatospora humi]
MTLDLAPATSALAALIREVKDGQLTAPTPCGGLTVGELLDHIDGLSIAFAAAGAKEDRSDGGRPRTPDASRLGADWRDRLAAQLDALAEAWRPADAWRGTARVGGGEMPAEVAGAAAVDEVLVHGWDLAVATGQRFPGEDPALAEALETAYAWVRTVVEQQPNGSPGLFGAPVPVAADAPLADRLIGLTGRRPEHASA